ncbi:hypothetical protein AVEN_39317-1 [Araneus ventricosus]|uniref:Uncharacterized protein n=1 Tax=Araneus ventricosus TaxID=182803 RepID=A0A4Y2X5B6_ARAVE|nr:hypothetical protein AVEN_39317-1 [Araneus ventricosus]
MRFRKILEDLEWSARSPDLNPSDFWLWGFPKDREHQRHATNEAGLKASIVGNVSLIPNDMLHASVDNAVGGPSRRMNSRRTSPIPPSATHPATLRLQSRTRGRKWNTLPLAGSHLLDCVALVYDDQLKRPDFVLEVMRANDLMDLI